MNFNDLIFNADIEGIKKLIEGGWSTNEPLEKGETALCYAIALENKEIIEILLEAGADINLSQKDDLAYTPLICAIRNCRGENLEMVEYLVEKGADLEKGDSRNGTLLLHSCICTYKSILLYLISKEAKVDCLDNEGQTPLHYICKFAADWSDYYITRTVNGITEEVKNNRIEDHFEIFKILIENKADTNKVTNYGFTPLHLADQKGGKIFIKPLVEAGADVNSENGNNYTPLHEAADAGDFKTANELLQLGANVNLKRFKDDYNLINTSKKIEQLVIVNDIAISGSQFKNNLTKLLNGEKAQNLQNVKKDELKKLIDQKVKIVFINCIYTDAFEEQVKNFLKTYNYNQDDIEFKGTKIDYRDYLFKKVIENYKDRKLFQEFVEKYYSFFSEKIVGISFMDYFENIENDDTKNILVARYKSMPKFHILIFSSKTNIFKYRIDK